MANTPTVVSPFRRLFEKNSAGGPLQLGLGGHSSWDEVFILTRSAKTCAIPRHSMYAIYAYIGGVNVGNIWQSHGVFGICRTS